MPLYSYRAVTSAGTIQTGQLELASRKDVVDHVRSKGLGLIEATETSARRTPSRKASAGAAARKAATRTISEIAVLLGAGLTLDRALTLALDNLSQPVARQSFLRITQQVKEGVSLSRAMAADPPLFTPMAVAMTESGETSGALGAALAKLAQTQERAQELRQTLISAMIYPCILLGISCSVILMMLLFVVPKFETLLSTAKDGALPPMTVAVLGASRGLREHGIMMAVIIAAVVAGLIHWFKTEYVRRAFDRLVLQLPQIGTIVTYSEAARFARVLASLVQGGVSLTHAMAIAQRSLLNTHIAAAISKVTDGLKEGSGLSGPLAASAVFPKIVLGFFRTGEETARLGDMLERLADVLDKDVQTFIKRFIAILTPMITVVLGGAVALVIASIMSAILGFNDLALG